MGHVAVVTDSSACIPPEIAAELRIRVLPISVYLPEDQRAEDLADGSEWILSEAAEQEERAGANHPFVTEYLAAIEDDKPEAAVVVTPAIEFAAMYRNAALASELATVPAVTIDARTAAAGQALVVLAGARAAADGANLETVVRVVEDASRRVELVASLGSLDPIRRSAAIPETVLAESALVQPAYDGSRSVFRMRDGTIESLGPPQTAEGALAAMRDAFRASTGGEVERSTVFHARAAELATRLEKMLGGVDFVSGFSVAMQVHTGQGVVGAAWLPRHPPADRS